MCGASALSQTADYPLTGENALHLSRPGRQLNKEDVTCGRYLWKSEKLPKVGPVVIYYFFGSQEYGKGKLGIYRPGQFVLVINNAKDPPTAQVILDSQGKFQSVRLQLTQAEYEAARSCFAL